MTNKPNPEQTRKKWAEIIAKAWTDEKFKQKLMANPSRVLKEYGIEPPAHKTFKIVEETKNEKYLILPESPSSTLSEEELVKIAAASGIDALLSQKYRW